MKMEELTNRKIGFVNEKDGNIYAFMNVPGPYALDDLKDMSGTYVFDGCKIGVKIKAGNGVRVDTSVVVLDDYSHPLTDVHGQKFRPICLGNYDPSGDSLYNKPIEKQIIRLLLKGRQVLQTGYTHECHPNVSLKNDGFADRRKSIGEINELGIPVTNTMVGYGKCWRNDD
jgi:hypothetical protein